jgi:hypothetical protein
MNTEVELEFGDVCIMVIAHLNDDEKKLINHQYENGEKIQSGCCGQSRCLNCMTGGVRILSINETDNPTHNEHLLSSILEDCYIGVVFKINLFNDLLLPDKTILVRDSVDYEIFKQIQNLSDKRLKLICKHSRHEVCELCKHKYCTVEILNSCHDTTIDIKNMSEIIISSIVLEKPFMELKDKDELIKYLPTDEKDLIEKVNTIGSISSFIESNDSKRTILINYGLNYGLTDIKILDYIFKTSLVEKNKLNRLIIFLSNAFKSVYISEDDKLVFSLTSFEEHRKWFEKALYFQTEKIILEPIVEEVNAVPLFESPEFTLEQYFIGLNYQDNIIAVSDLSRYLFDPKIHL